MGEDGFVEDEGGGGRGFEVVRIQRGYDVGDGRWVDVDEAHLGEDQGG